MDLQQLLGRNILIRLTEDGGGFVSTLRYGPLYRHSTTWTLEFLLQTEQEPVIDDSLYADED
jgi:hypothetical protein